MKIPIASIAWCALLIVASLVVAQDALQSTEIESTGDDRFLEPLENRNGWVNPEDLAPMPQCIAQQDPSIWLSAMTKCTHKQCTRHFGVFCTRHQWLTQLSCLSTEFSTDVVKTYLPYCNRSVLANAQLFEWTHTITGRMWLVDVGDAIELQALSPASLAEGYADVEVISKAPMCLQESASAPSNELFGRVLASCGFTANTQHTGNALRPWEYRESSGSMVALDSQTVGYDLTRHSVPYGDYFDKYCFCKAFNVIHTAEPCSGDLALTRERLWLHATCGSKSVPTNWKAGLKTTTFDYIPTTAWHWPTRVNDMPEKVLQLPDQCSTDACEVDANGYCKIKHAIDRSCFCRSVDYNTCKGPCHEFEARIDFVNWLHDLCGNVEGWDGLPKNWRLLAAPMPHDLIPWPWSVKSSKHSPSARTCVFTEWKLLGLVLINAATLVTTVFVPGSQTLRHAHEHLYYMLLRSWFVKGLLITGLYLLANGINAALTKSEFGYDHVPTMELVLLWCSMPRLTWLSVFQATNFSTIASALFAESILQVLSASHLIATVRYGWEHDFYGNGMEKIASSYSAQLMYAGALMWLIVVVVAAILLLQTARSKNMPAMDTERNGWNKRATPNAAEELATTFNEQWSWLEERIVLYWSSTRYEPELRPSTRHNGHAYVSYGTLPATTTRVLIVAKSTVRLYIISVISMVLLWIAQWLFWAGFIGLSLGEYCPPQLSILTVVWMASSAAVALVAANT